MPLPPEAAGAARPIPTMRCPISRRRSRAPAPRCAQTRARGRLLRDAARRRHRLGQDRGLFRGGGGGDRAAAGRALILMPEIALTAQFLDRFAARFGVRPAEWHSAADRRASAPAPGGASRRARSRVVVGARSALFLPYADLGLDRRRRGARRRLQAGGRRALPRPRHGGGARAISPRFRSCSPRRRRRSRPRSTRGAAATAASHLPERFGGQRMPAIEAIDLTREGPPRGRFIAPRLAEAVKTALERGEQALLFLNRRGYAPLTLCRACGFRFACPNCDAWLVEHRFKRQLVCHHCGFAMPRPAACPKCQAADSLRRLRARRRAARGGGGEAVSRGAHPGAVERPDRDGRAHARGVEGRSTRAASTSSSAPSWSPRGTIFRSSTWSAIIDADLGLANGDPRAAERTFQLLHQVGGPRRPRSRPRPRLSADPPARPSGDAGADRRRPRGVLCERDRGAREDPLSAVRAAREPHRLRPATGRRPKAMRAGSPPQRRTTSACACSARPRRRSR